MHREANIIGCWVSVGIAQQIALSIVISKYSVSLDVGPFYLVLEF
jgi:hypothetical protein